MHRHWVQSPIRTANDAKRNVGGERGRTHDLWEVSRGRKGDVERRSGSGLADCGVTFGSNVHCN